jgi:hypothetical protein
MHISSKIFSAVALAVALFPLAAHAERNVQPGPARYYLAPMNHQDQVMRGSTTIDNPTTIYSGVGPNAFRDSMGG